jgi:hypothetical protein
MIAAGAIQLVGATFGLFAAVSTALMAAQTDHGPVHEAFVASVIVDATIAGIVIPASIGLLFRRRWGWWVSMVVMSLIGLALLAFPFASASKTHVMGVGYGEWIVLAFLGAPIFVTVGLLIGGRHAVFASSTKTATEPPAATLRGG